MRPSRALITGASSGIGACYARRLAADGVDVVLVARRADRLESLADDLQRLGVGVEVLVADLASEAGLAAVAARLAVIDAPVDLLVNNAGFGTTGNFAELPVDRELDTIRLNVSALVRLTHAALRAMSSAGGGAIVNVASLAAFQPLAKSATYAATKAFVLSFTQSLADEAQESGVRFQVLCPGFTRTEFHSVNDYDVSWLPSFVWQSAEEVVATSLGALGGSRVVVVPGLVNRLAATFSSLAPNRLVVAIASALVRR
ncbi:MAG TPA: SDR family oxidoreductase [Acidimicrobiales bacterium]|nr:SDR family oxidoreductase [Acidimicrobiales bacterium]